MAQDNAALLQAAYDDRVSEYRQHCADRKLGKYKTTYSLNGRSFDWNEYERQTLESLEKLPQLLSGASIAYIETRVR